MLMLLSEIDKWQIIKCKLFEWLLLLVHYQSIWSIRLLHYRLLLLASFFVHRLGELMTCKWHSLTGFLPHSQSVGHHRQWCYVSVQPVPITASLSVCSLASIGVGCLCAELVASRKLRGVIPVPYLIRWLMSPKGPPTRANTVRTDQINQTVARDRQWPSSDTLITLDSVVRGYCLTHGLVVLATRGQIGLLATHFPLDDSPSLFIAAIHLVPYPTMSLVAATVCLPFVGPLKFVRRVRCGQTSVWRSLCVVKWATMWHRCDTRHCVDVTSRWPTARDQST